MQNAFLGHFWSFLAHFRRFWHFAIHANRFLVKTIHVISPLNRPCPAVIGDKTPHAHAHSITSKSVKNK